MTSLPSGDVVFTYLIDFGQALVVGSPYHGKRKGTEKNEFTHTQKKERGSSRTHSEFKNDLT
jgi:hypothetical protein